jgi:hypothetical protein
LPWPRSFLIYIILIRNNKNVKGKTPELSSREKARESTEKQRNGQPFAGVIGDRRTWRALLETVKGIIASGSVIRI